VNSKSSATEPSAGTWKETLTRRLRRLRDPISIYHQLKTRPNSESQYRSRIHTSTTAQNSLEADALAHSGQPFTKSWHYLEFYNERLGEIAERSRNGSLPAPLRILEIGVWKGGSLQLWRKLFGESAIIYGIDIDEACLHLPDPGAVVRIGSQTDPKFLNRVVQEMGGVDIVIDDGSHRCKDVIDSFHALFPLMSQGGYYFVEDLHTSYWPQWQGGLRRPDTSIEFFKDFADVVNSDYFQKSPTRSGEVPEARSIYSVEFVDSIALVRKKMRKPAHIFYGGVHDPDYLAFWGASQ